MIRFAFKKGLIFLELTRAWTLTRRLVNGKLEFEDPDGEREKLSESEVYDRWRSGKWIIDTESLSQACKVFYLTTPKDISSLREKDKENARRKSDYLTKLERIYQEGGSSLKSTPVALKAHIETIALELGDESPPDTTTVWRWWKKFQPTKCIGALVDRRGRVVRHIDATLMSLFEEVLSEVFLTPQKRPGKAVVEAMRTKIRRLNSGLKPEEHIKGPSQATVYRWLKELYYRVVQNAREGKAATAKELRAAIGTVEVESILDRIEVDHTPLDILIIDSITKLILGRPWITLAIDRKSRMVVGFYISFHAPSSYSVLYCLRMSILPKDDILKRFPDIKTEWPARGIPILVVSDNGMELHSIALETIHYELGIEHQYCGVAMPEMKGAIERLFRTMSEGLIHTLPGTVFSNVQKRADYESEKHAAIDLETMTHILTKWIVDVYHNTPHRGLQGFSPLQVWKQEEAQKVIELPAFPSQLNTLVGHTTTRTLFHYGLEFECLRYNSTQLQTILGCEGGNPQLMIRSYEHDVGYISVFDPKLDAYFDVPAVNKPYAEGLNRYVHSLVRAQIRARFGDEWRDEQLLAFKEEIQGLVNAAINAKKTGTRKKSAAVNCSDSEAIFGQSRDFLTDARLQVDPALKPTQNIDSGEDDLLPDYGHSTRSMGV